MTLTRDTMAEMREKAKACAEFPVSAFSAHPEEILELLDEIERLQKRVDLLDALEACGVDNWNGYSDAMQSLGETE